MESMSLLLTGLILGLILIISFMVCMCCRPASARQLTVFKVSLICTALLQSLSSPVAIMATQGDPCQVKYCYKLEAVWRTSINSGTLLHLLVALECVLLHFCRRLREGGKATPLYVSVPVVVALEVVCLLFCAVPEADVAFSAFGLALTLALGLSPCYLRVGMNSHLCGVIMTAFISFNVAYLPFTAFQYFYIANSPIHSEWPYIVCQSLTNLRLVGDGFLLFVTSRQPVEEAPQQEEVEEVNLPSIRRAHV